MPYEGTTPRKSGYVIPHLTGVLPRESYVMSYRSSRRHVSRPPFCKMADCAFFFTHPHSGSVSGPKIRNSCAGAHVKVAGTKTEPAMPGAFAPRFGGANLHPLFLNLGPWELPQVWIKGPITTHEVGYY